MRNLTILGSTGSVGVNTLDVTARHPGEFCVVALTARDRIDVLLKQCLTHKPRYAVMLEPAAARELARRLAEAGSVTQVSSGIEALEEVASLPDVDTVMAAIVGIAGLRPTLAAVRAGKKVLLANKESLVTAGALFMDAVKKSGATLLPIDSEHSAIFQSLPENPGDWASRVDKIILTASGGPFRTRDPLTLREVTPEQACAHPNWVMGRKISVDSATMMNKALEVIEAKFLFGLAPEKIEVVVHPQSVIHSMVQYVDNSVVAQLGTPDMRGPIAYGLSWPHRVESGASALDFSSMSALTFESMDTNGHKDRFPGLDLAWAVLNAPAGTTAVLNAANEVAVAAFLDRRIRFDQIHHVNMETLSAVAPEAPRSLEDLLALDEQSRRAADHAIQHFPA